MGASYIQRTTCGLDTSYKPNKLNGDSLLCPTSLRVHVLNLYVPVLIGSLTGVSPEVNELLMEAQLLQVSLPEIQELYQTLLTKSSSAQQTDRSSPVRASSEKVSDSCWEAHLQHLHLVSLPSDLVREMALS